MFTFTDIVDRVEPRDVSSITRSIDEEILMTALKSAQTQGMPTAPFMLSNLPKRLSERIKEDLDAMPDVKLKDGEAAQRSRLSRRMKSDVCLNFAKPRPPNEKVAD